MATQSTWGGRSKMAFLQTEIISHTRKVCSLYKKAARTLQCWTPDRLSFRYEVTILRDRFEQNRNLTDVAKLQKVLQESEKELQKAALPANQIPLFTRRCCIW